MKRARYALLTFATSIAVVLLLEATLDLIALASPRVAKILAPPWEPPGIADTRLGSRPNPLFPGHDSNGFRNARVPSTADIVAFGDSQTYGTGVSGDDAWPSLLQSVTGRSVYSIAFGGFGPVHTLALWENALKLRPNTIIEALYTGNDLYDAFAMVYSRNQSPLFRANDPTIQQRIHLAENSEPLAARVDRLIAMCLPHYTAPDAADRPEPGFFLRDVLRNHSGLYGLARRALFVARDLATSQPPDLDADWQAQLALVRGRSDECQSFDDGARRTIFTSTYRLNALDADDVRIAEGARITLAAVGEMHRRASSAGVRFILLEIPTKELVFYPRVRKPSASYERLVEQEERFRDLLRRHLHAAGIEHIDALPALRLALDTGSSPYQAAIDGHPNELGHSTIAGLVADRLSARDSAIAP